MITKQHYVAIAAIIRKNLLYSELDDPKYRGIVIDFADYFAADNPLFDRQKFLDTCGI